MTKTLHADIARVCVGGWYTPGKPSTREVGEVFRLGGHPVAVLAVRTTRSAVGAPDDADADGEMVTRSLLLRDATAQEMAVAEASRAAFRAGAGVDHPARAANSEQMRRIAAEVSGQ